MNVTTARPGTPAGSPAVSWQSSRQEVGLGEGAQGVLKRRFCGVFQTQAHFEEGAKAALRASQRFVDRDLSERVIIIIVIESTKRDV